MSEVELPATPSSDAQAEAQREQMQRLSIAFNGRHYQYGRYRYDRLADAVAYATLSRARGLPDEDAGSTASVEHVDVPDESDRAVMADLAITYEGGIFRYASYRYDRLADAVRYAKQVKAGGVDAARTRTR